MYADVITNPDPFYVRIYIGSAAGVYKGRKDTGLSRRIKEHISFIKNGSRPESGMLHVQELKQAAAQPNFIVLVRFAEEVELPVVRIAEELMTILFRAWDNQAFHSLRPGGLAPIPRHYGLNNANPLTGGFLVHNDLTHPEDSDKREQYVTRCRLMGERRAAANKAKSIKNAREGGPVTITRFRASKYGRCQFRFKALKQQTFVPYQLAKDLGLDVTKKVNVVYDISVGKPHHTPYSCKAKFEDPGRCLGIMLKGKYGQGARKGLMFEKWIQCRSVRAISTANGILELIQEPICA